MRFRVLLCALLLALLPLSMAAADTVTYGDITYIFPGEAAEPATLTLVVEGTSFDQQTLEPVTEAALPGAVFGIYAKDASGAFVPYRDPANPLVPLRVTSGATPVSIALPLSVDLYIRQESAPEGYTMEAEAETYQPLTLPQTITFYSRRADMQGVWLTLVADTPEGEMPLEGISFTLEGMGETHRITTDDEGKASAAGIAPGEYTLRQSLTIEGYHIDEPEMQLTIAAHEPLSLSIRNSRDGTLALRTLGLAMDGTRTPRLIPIERTYEVFDADGTRQGTLSGGETLALRATQAGTTYTLRTAQTAQDGFAVDTQTHTITLFPGQTATCQTVVQSEKGFFSFGHISAEDERPVAGGMFSLENEAGDSILSFSPDENGHYELLEPLPPGTYTLRMKQAAEGFMYAQDALTVTIEPYLSAGQPIAQVAFTSEPVPAVLLAPTVESDIQLLPSLFDADAKIDFTLRTIMGPTSLAVEGLSYEFFLPQTEGLVVDEKRADGAGLSVARRLPLQGVEEITELRVHGTVSYSFSYQTDAAGTLRTVPVSMPFNVSVASFGPSASAGQFAISGHVYDENGQPIPGFTVSLGGQSMQTDPFGAYAFANAPSGDTVAFHPEDGYGAKMDENDARILPLRTITGKVEVHGELSGYPASLFIGDEGPVQPDTNGRFTITGILASTDKLRAEAQDGVLVRIDQDGDAATVELYAAASVSGRIIDPDGNPVSDARVTLGGGGQNQSVQSDVSGSYAFADLFPGSYTIEVAPPAGYILNGEGEIAFDLKAGDVHVAEEASMMRPASIEGALLDGENPFAGITVTLLPGEILAETDEAGHFAFDGLTTGEYTLSFDVGEETVLMDQPEVITITSSGEKAQVTVHAVRPARLLGRVWFDANDDGLLSQDETGLADVVVTLYDAQETVVETFTTVQNGDFAFTGLMPGQYRLGVKLPGDMIFSREAPGVDRIAYGVDGQEAMSGWYTLVSGQKLDGLICGGIESGTVTGTLWLDADGNGVMEAKESKLAGASVSLTREGQTAQQVQTDAQGAYAFEYLRPGDYTLRIELPQGHMFTIQASGVDGIVSDIPATKTGVAEHALSLRQWRMTPVVNAGAQRAATLSARVWFNTGASGVTAENSPYAGMTVALYDTAGSSPALISEQSTDVQGNVRFETLRPGTYQLRYQLPEAEGWGFTEGVTETVQGWGYGSPVVLEDGGAADAALVGITKLGSISGIAFGDVDYNGLRDDGEAGVVMDVALLGNDGTVLRTQQTQPDGSYLFDGLPTGLYTIRFTSPQGYAFTRERADAPSFNSDVPESSEPSSQTSPLYLPMGETILVDAGVYQPASVEGTIWQDVQNNGLYATENPPVAGISVTLLRGGKEVEKSTTDEQGIYKFSSLPPDSYSIRVELSEGMRFSTRPADTTMPGSTIQNTDKLVGETAAVTLRSNEQWKNMDAGVVFTGSVSGKAINLKDNQGLAGVSVALTRSGISLAETTTSSDGSYQLKDVRPGSAQIRFTTPEGWAVGAEQENPVDVTIPQRSDAAGINASCLPESTIEGHLWLDGNADGQQDEAEAPLLGVTVQLYWQTGDAPELLDTDSTDSNGRYYFDKLLPGVYTLRFTPPEGMIFYDGNETAPFTLGMGEERQLTGAAYIASSISGAVWEDANNDGLRAMDDAVLADVEVTLVRPNGSVVAQTLTDSMGNYRFDRLQPIECAVRFTLPDAYVFTEAAEGGSVVPLTDSNTGLTKVMSLTMGDNIKGMDAGAVRHTRVGDLVWLDENANGLQDTTEPGVPNIAVQLLRVNADGSEDLVAETITDINGRYRFNAVRPGTYRISLRVGENYLPTRNVPELDQINSKLLWDEGPILRSDVFTALSGKHQLNIDAGLVTLEMGRLVGWAVAATPEATAAATATPGPETTEKGADTPQIEENATEEENVDDGETFFRPGNIN